MNHLFLEAAARTAHEVNRVWCEYNGDFSQKPWDEAPVELRNSARNGVQFHIKNPDAGDSGSHDNWTKFKVAEGYVWGEVKDLEAKTHPCLVPFSELPREQQLKDAFFRTVVHAIIASAQATADRK